MALVAVLTALAVAVWGMSGVLWGLVGLSGLWGLVAALTLWEKRSLGRVYEASWRTICHVLDQDHDHEGAVLKGTWKGRPFEAVATAYSLGQYGGTVMRYRLAMPAGQPGPAWKAERADWEGPRGSSQWTVRSDEGSAEERLVEAGLLTAIDDAEQRAIHRRRGVRLSFHPRRAEVSYDDQSGEPPCADDLVVHLDLVRRAVDIHAAAMV